MGLRHGFMQCGVSGFFAGMVRVSGSGTRALGFGFMEGFERLGSPLALGTLELTQAYKPNYNPETTKRTP